jgi:hypothetical protein
MAPVKLIISVAEKTINDGLGGNGVSLQSFTIIPKPGNLGLIGIALVTMIGLHVRKTSSAPMA